MVPAADFTARAVTPRTFAYYVAAAAADNTRRAYQNDLRAFMALALCNKRRAINCTQRPPLGSPKDGLAGPLSAISC